MGQVAEHLQNEQQDRWCSTVDRAVDEIAKKSQDAVAHRELLADGKKLPPGLKHPQKYPTCTELDEVRAVAKPLGEFLPDLLPLYALHDVDGGRDGGLFISPDQYAATFLEELEAAMDGNLEHKPWSEFVSLVEATRKRSGAPVINWLWRCRTMVEGDGYLKRPVGGRVSVTSVLERGQDSQAPFFRIEVSLPWWLLAHPDEQRAEVHRLMCFCGIKDDGSSPYKRKPHLVLHNMHVARFGIPRDPLSAQVAAHIIHHPTTAQRLRRYAFDSKTKQGLLFRPVAPEDKDLDDRIANLRAPVVAGDA